MEFFEAIKARRSVREYLPTPVGRDVLERIIAAGVEAPSGANMQLRQYVIIDDAAVMEKLRPISKALTGAPAAIVLLIEPKATRHGEFWIQDASAAMENMLLAAVALGYGSCWVEGAVRRYEEQLREILAVPKHLRPWALMPVGKPASVPERPQKSDPADVVHYNRYGGR